MQTSLSPDGKNAVEQKQAKKLGPIVITEEDKYSVVKNTLQANQVAFKGLYSAQEVKFSPTTVMASGRRSASLMKSSPEGVLHAASRNTFKKPSLVG